VGYFAWRDGQYQSRLLQLEVHVNKIPNFNARVHHGTKFNAIPRIQCYFTITLASFTKLTSSAKNTEQQQMHKEFFRQL
jgi:hypothetical protein